MTNLILWLIMLIIVFSFVLASYKIFGKMGLFAIIPILVILSDVQVLVNINILGCVNTLGNITYAGIFLISDTLTEIYGKKDAKKGINIGIFTMVFVNIMMILAIHFVPIQNNFSINNYNALKRIFTLIPRISLASWCAYYVSQNINIFLYHRLKQKSKGTKIWFRSILSTFFGEMIDNIIFTFLAFFGVLNFKIMVMIFFSSYIMKLLVGVLDTPLIYLARKIKKD